MAMTVEEKPKVRDMKANLYPISFEIGHTVGGCCGTIVVSNYRQDDVIEKWWPRYTQIPNTPLKNRR
jgi:hypothetical protein